MTNNTEAIFPSIPYLPGTDNLGNRLEEKEKKYAGAPRTAQDSELLFPTDAAKQAYDSFQNFAKLRLSSEKQDFCRNLSQKLIKKPLLLAEIFLYWDFHGLNESQAVARELKYYFEKVVSKQITESKIKLPANEYFTFFEQAAKSPYRKLLEKVIAAFLSLEKNPVALVHLFYEIVAYSIKKEDEELIIYLLNVLNYNTEILTAESETTLKLISNMFSPDDEALKEYLELDAFADILAPLYQPELTKVKDMANTTIIDSVIDGLKQDNPAFFHDERNLAILKFYNSFESGGYSGVSEEQEGIFPYNLAFEGGPVRAYYDQMAIKLSNPLPNQEIYQFALPSGSTALHRLTNDQANDHEYFQKMITNDLNKTEEASSSTIQSQREAVGMKLDALQSKAIIDFLRPQIMDLQQLGEIIKLNFDLKKTIKIDSKRSISAQGTRIIISDLDLVALGYKSMLFEYADNKPELLVTLAFGKNNYQTTFLLDINKKLLDPKTRKPITNGEINAEYASVQWMEAVVLSHFVEYSCSKKIHRKNMPTIDENESKKAAASDREEDFEKWERTIASRIGHIRNIGKNESCSKEQVELARDEQGWDLLEMNANRLEAGLLPCTYVRIVDKPFDTHREAVQFQSHLAMDRLRAILAN